MKRNLKILGLALMTTLALSAAIASAASAQNGTLTSDGPITLIGTQTGAATENAITAFGGETQCASATYTGHKYNSTPHELIPNDVSTITVTPHYGPCTSLGFPATIDMNGCDYVQHLEGTTGADKYAVKSEILCPQGSHITVTIFGSSAKHTAGEPFCHFTITENPAGYAGLSATDTTNGKEDISGTITGLSMDKKSPTGSILCTESTTTTGSMKVDILGEGKNAEGGATALSLSHL